MSDQKIQYIAKARRAISEQFPDFEIQTITFLGEGFDNFAVLVNEEIVFRFVKFPGSTTFGSGMGGGLAVEACLLPKLASHISIDIPNFEYIGHDQGSTSFVGYKSISGNQFSEEQWLGLTAMEQAMLTQDITTFISQLHSFPIELAKSCNVKEVNFFQRYQNDTVKFIESVAPLLEDTISKKIEKMFDAYLSDEKNFSYKPVLLHADLWFSHLFIDLDTKRLSGVIDFSDMIIGDPDYDFIQMAITGGKTTVAAMMSSLPDSQRVPINQVMEKARFFYRFNLIQDTIFFLETNNAKGVKYNLDEIQKVSTTMGWG